MGRLVRIIIGTLLFIILNIILIPMTGILSNGWLLYLGSILTFIQIVVGFSVVYGIMVDKLCNSNRNGDINGFK